MINHELEVGAVIFGSTSGGHVIPTFCGKFNVFSAQYGVATLASSVEAEALAVEVEVLIQRGSDPRDVALMLGRH